MADLTRNAGADDETAAAEAAARKSERRARDVLRGIMMKPDGRAWLWEFLTDTFCFEEPFVPGEPDTTARNLGRQTVGKRMMLQAMAASTDLYLTMMREAREIEEAERKRKAQAEQSAQKEAEQADEPDSPDDGLPAPEPLKIDRTI